MYLKLRSFAAITALVFVGTSCDVVTRPDSDLDAARARWAFKHPSSYDIVVHRICFCGTETTNPVLVSVRDGVIVSRTYVGSGAAVGVQIAQYFPNVEGIFLIVDDALTRHAATIEVTYEPTYGYPMRINIDYVKNAADDELVVEMSGFVVK